MNITTRANNLIGALSLICRSVNKGVVGYIGWVGHKNLGDEAMYNAVAGKIRTKLIISSGFLCWKIMCRTSMKVCIFGGGTLIFSYYQKYLAYAIKCNIPCFILGTGVRSKEFWLMYNKKRIECFDEWMSCLNNVRAIDVRGPISKAELESLGINNVNVIGDPALLYYEKFDRGECNNIIGVNYGTSRGYLWGGDEYEPIYKLSEALKYYIERRYHIRFYCVWPEDYDMIRALAAKCEIKQPDIELHYDSAEKYIKSVRECRAFIGMKLHAVMLAVCASVPSIMLEYRPKCRDFMESVCYEENNIRIDQIEKNELISKINTILCENELPNRVSEKMSIYKAKLLHQLQDINDSIL